MTLRFDTMCVLNDKHFRLDYKYSKMLPVINALENLDTYSEFGHMAIKGRPFQLTYKGGSPELNFIAKLFRLT